VLWLQTILAGHARVKDVLSANHVTVKDSGIVARAVVQGSMILIHREGQGIVAEHAMAPVVPFAGHAAVMVGRHVANAAVLEYTLHNQG
jgi:hypothetical protein